MLALITPTGARPQQLQLCAKYMANQTYAGAVLWIIVDDALPQSSDFIAEDFRPNWQVLKVYPQPPWEAGQNTQGRNLKAGIDALLAAVPVRDIEAIFIIEDDDYYKPHYLTAMAAQLDGALAFGETHTVYYNVRLRRWIEHENAEWSSLFQTAMRPAALKWFNMLYGEKFIDYAFFRLCPKVKLFRTSEKLSIGMKGIAGRAGIGAGHGYIPHMLADHDATKLAALLGADAEPYLQYYDWPCSNV
jgi:hypothetical protein